MYNRKEVNIAMTPYNEAEEYEEIMTTMYDYLQPGLQSDEYLQPIDDPHSSLSVKSDKMNEIKVLPPTQSHVFSSFSNDVQNLVSQHTTTNLLSSSFRKRNKEIHPTDSKLKVDKVNFTNKNSAQIAEVITRPEENVTSQNEDAEADIYINDDDNYRIYQRFVR